MDSHVRAISAGEDEIDSVDFVVVVPFVDDGGHTGSSYSIAIARDCEGLSMKSNPSPPVGRVCDVDSMPHLVGQRPPEVLNNILVGRMCSNAYQRAETLVQVEYNHLSCGRGKPFSIHVARLSSRGDAAPD